MADPASEGWHLDRRVPIALLLGLIFQFIGVVVYATSIAKDVESNQAKIGEMKKKAEKQDETLGDINNRLIGLERDVKHGNNLLQQLINQQREQQRRR